MVIRFDLIITINKSESDMLHSLVIILFSFSLFSAIAALIYFKIIEPLSKITYDFKQASFEHNLLTRLEEMTNTKGLSEQYNVMLNNNICESDYFDKLKAQLDARSKKTTILQTVSIFGTTMQLKNNKKSVKYH